jgi:hemoglobin
VEKAVPTLYEWAGGEPALLRLTAAFYERVRADPVLAPVFAQMPDDHPRHVAMWLGEVFGGPPRYTEQHGGYPHMLAKHRDRR